MIDKKGNIFGVINIIDLLLILFVLLCIVAAFVVLKPKSGADTSSEQTYDVTFYSSNVPNYVANQIKVGQTALDEAKNVNLGKVVNVVTNPGFEYTPTASGKMVKAYEEDYTELSVTTEVTAAPSSNGIFIQGNRYGIGHGATYYFGNSKFYGYISDIEVPGTSDGTTTSSDASADTTQSDTSTVTTDAATSNDANSETVTQ